MIAVGDVNDVMAVAAPDRADLMIEGAVVVARQVALGKTQSLRPRTEAAVPYVGSPLVWSGIA